jgi:superfamily II DNA or RNA helicase
MTKRSEDDGRLGNIVLDPFQKRIAGNVSRWFAKRLVGVVKAPTGSGKSVIVAAAAAGALADGRRPVVILCPSATLLNQNLAALRTSGALEGRTVALHVARKPAGKLPPGTEAQTKAEDRNFDADVILATTQVSVRIRDRDEGCFAKLGKNAFALYDEGQGGGAEETSEIFAEFAKGKVPTLFLSATPFRTDGVDIAEPFGKRTADVMIDVATYAETRASGRTLPAKFSLRRAELAERLGTSAIDAMERRFLDAYEKIGNIDAASSSAFGAFFGKAKTEADREVGRRMTETMTALWSEEVAASGARLSLWHCESIEHAEAIAGRVASMKRADSAEARRPDAGKAFRTAILHSKKCGLVRNDGTIDGLGLAPDKARERILELARKGELDAVVSCKALGVGVDIPVADLSVLAFHRRCMLSLEQTVGRTARAHIDGSTGKPAIDPLTGRVKAEHRILDFGTSVETLRADILAAREGRPLPARSEIARAHPMAWENLAAIFDEDPTLKDAVERSKRLVAAKRTAEAKAKTDAPVPVEADDELRAEGNSPPAAGKRLIPPRMAVLGKGIVGLSSKVSWKNRDEQLVYDTNSALIIDLVETGLVSTAHAGPRFAMAVRRGRHDVVNAGIFNSIDDAAAAAAAIGVGYERGAKDGRNFTASPATERLATTLAKQAAAAGVPVTDRFISVSGPTCVSGMSVLANWGALCAGIRGRLARALHPTRLEGRAPKALRLSDISSFDDTRIETLRAWLALPGSCLSGGALADEAPTLLLDDEKEAALLRLRIGNDVAVAIRPIPNDSSPKGRAAIASLALDEIPAIGPAGAAERRIFSRLETEEFSPREAPKAKPPIRGFAPPPRKNPTTKPTGTKSDETRRLDKNEATGDADINVAMRSIAFLEAMNGVSKESKLSVPNELADAIRTLAANLIEARLIEKNETRNEKGIRTGIRWRRPNDVRTKILQAAKPSIRSIVDAVTKIKDAAAAKSVSDALGHPKLSGIRTLTRTLIEENGEKKTTQR